jgi:hypothetical protein
LLFSRDSHKVALIVLVIFHELSLDAVGQLLWEEAGLVLAIPASLSQLGVLLLKKHLLLFDRLDGYVFAGRCLLQNRNVLSLEFEN